MLKNKLSPKEHVLEALRQGNKSKIQAYMKRYFKLRREEEIKTAKKIFAK